MDIFLIEDFFIFILIFFRLLAFISVAPGFSARGIPNLAKIGFSLIFAYVLYLSIPAAAPMQHESFIELGLLVIKEVLFGLALGFTVNLIFLSFQMAGQMVDFQMGFSMASYYDPLTNSRVSIFGNLYHWIGLTLFFVINGHYILIYSFVQSFDLIPLAGLELSAMDLQAIVGIFSRSFLTAFQIAVPVIFVILLTDAVIGLVSRSVPQINILMLGLPLKVLVGLLALTIIMPAIGNMLVNAINGIQGRMEEFIQSLPSLLLFVPGGGAGGEKTEDPTPKRKADAREKGQVAKSNDLNSALILILLIIMIAVLGNTTYNGIFASLHKTLETGLNQDVSWGSIGGIMLGHLLGYLRITLPIMLVVMIAGIVANLTQVGFMATLHPIKPDFKKLNPIEGFKKIFSMRTLVELIKNLFKLGIVAYVAYTYLRDNISRILSVSQMNVTTALPFFMELFRGMMIRVGIWLIIIGILDYVYQRYEHKKGLKMSKQEIKDEIKEQEGDPQLKAHIRQKQRQMGMSRMMKDVPEATFVVTNPTRLAIALRYLESSEEGAPVVLAKGAGHLAHRIRTIAEEEDISIVENKPLATALYKDVGVGQEIPIELYQAVAEILAVVYRMEGRDRANV
ncbi:MAG TPA: flagellar biosynthesis protein FlhB [Bacillota bacterium]|nr:flagellar biosynthesis protein FlhB [Bacillota bacterium]